MRKILLFILTAALMLYAETLFEVKDASDHTVLDVSTDGLRILNYPDTLMVISTAEIKAVIDDSKVLSRKFSVTTSSSKKGLGTDVFEVTKGATRMREGDGAKYTDFSPDNIFLGLNAGVATTPNLSNGVDNIFVGNYSGKTNYSGRQNIFIGKNAGYKNYSGYGSTIVGLDAGYNNTGNVNVFIGNGAGYSNGSTGMNTYLGNSTGYNQTSGASNIYIGSGTGMNKTSGNNNTMVGTFSGGFNSAGSGNVFLGYNAGYVEEGSNKLYIANSDTSTPLIKGTFPNTDLTLTAGKVSVIHPYGTTNGLYIQSSYNGNTDNWHFYQLSTDFLELYFNTSYRGQWDTTSGAYSYVSDKKLKKNIENLGSVRDKFMKLEPKIFNYTSQKDGDVKHTGLIAQEVLELFPEFVSYNDEEDIYSVNYAGLSVIAIQAIKEQQREIETLTKRLELVEDMIKKMKE